MAIRRPNRDPGPAEPSPSRDQEPAQQRAAWSAETAPTMIIPQGTEIEIDAHGQLSIRAPGNLVLQNSGSYGSLVSMTGSIRIDHGVEVEAVSVQAADSCYVQGNLTAWKVKARTLQIEESGRAHVVLQETEHLEVGREARLVGNFGSEKELFLLFSRFADQVRSLPFFRDRALEEHRTAGALAEPAPQPAAGERPVARLDPDTAAAIEHLLASESPPAQGAPAPGAPAPGASAAGSPAPRPAAPGSASPGPASKPPGAAYPSRPASDRSPLGDAGADEEFPEPLLFALVLLEREADRQTYGPTSQRALDELIKLLRDRDMVTLRHIYRTLFGRVVEPREDVQRAHELIHQYYES
jgi:hypothetical protein